MIWYWLKIWTVAAEFCIPLRVPLEPQTHWITRENQNNNWSATLIIHIIVTAMYYFRFTHFSWFSRLRFAIFIVLFSCLFSSFYCLCMRSPYFWVVYYRLIAISLCLFPNGLFARTFVVYFYDSLLYFITLGYLCSIWECINCVKIVWVC